MSTQNKRQIREQAQVIVSAYHHDQEADNVQFVRNEGEDARRTADLLKQCGYQVGIYRQPVPNE